MATLATSAEISAIRPGRFAALLDRHQVPGAQLAVYRDGELATATAGTLDCDTGAPVTANAAFPLGSITKMFTATLAMILVADGDLELDTPIREYLPELADDDDLADRVTLAHLLSHTSGLPCNPPEDPDGVIGPGRYVAAHCTRENLICEPGSAFSYSNLGYVVVGRIIEAVTGMSWHEAMTSILLRPLGIDPAYVCFDQEATRPVATGHAGNPANGRLRPVEQALDPVEAPTGAIAASAVDLVTLGRLHLADGRPDLLPAPLAARMRQPVPHADPFGLAEGWGLGLTVHRGSVVGHDGNGYGTACYLRVDPAKGLVVALTTNATQAYRLWEDILELLAEDGIAAGPAKATRPRQVDRASHLTRAAGGRGSDGRHGQRPAGRERPHAASVGRYANGAVNYVVSADHTDQLRLTVDEEMSAPLVLEADLAFSLIDPQSDTATFGGRFMRDTTGEISAIQVGGRLAVRVGRSGSRHTPRTMRHSA